MQLIDIISRDAVIANAKSNSKKQLLSDIADVAAAETGRDPRTIFELLLQRERLGSTGIGNGVAIPHGKLPDLDRITGVFARLAKPVPFDAMDDEPVDLVFAIIAPEGSGADHLKALSRIARIMRNADTLAALRQTDDRDIIYSLLGNDEKANAA
ncbi:MAG: PTS IIA-like nitrogen regulatory protein PtsN [Ahrensia sp.]|nr:PTS IIA-like nitrogen regulatory protein PtsN [Ahrensia sp.]